MLHRRAAFRLLRDREISPIELTRAYLDQIDIVDPSVRAF
jgi:Asp-tRNA(Asn)/Glu-tRNA(Gln) amidotransferase A subunit family amidase